MSITKAVIACAGFGTRMLPITKTIQKEMLPILDRPLVDYIVADCLCAGITEIIFVINAHNKQLPHYYTENTRIKEFLDKMGKSDRYNKIAHLHTQAKFTFVHQPSDAPYGTATPVRLVEPYIEPNEPFLVYMGDDFLFNKDDFCETAAMIKLFETSQAEALATCLPKPQDILHKYGVAKTKQQNNYTYLEKLIEKPAPGTAPSNLTNISKYIFTPKVFEYIKHQELDSNSGELFITDTISNIAKEHPVVIYQPNGIYLDGGYLEGWLLANLTVAINTPELKAKIKELVND